MAIEFKKTSIKGHTPEIWRGECKMLPGGFKPKNNIPVGSVVYRGVLVEVNFSEMSAAVIKIATVLNGGTTSKPRIAKGHLFAAGDVIAMVGKDDKSVSISSIDTANADYDVLNLSAAITGLASGKAIVEASDYGYIDADASTEGALKIVADNPSDGQIALASVTPYLGEKTLAANDYVLLQKAEAKYTPNMVNGAVKEFNGKGLPTIDAAYEAVVLYPSLNFPILPEWLNGCCLKSNPNILFIKQ
jgi:hypothetical protein